MMMYNPFRNMSTMMRDIQNMFGSMSSRSMNEGQVGENGAMYSSSTFMSYNNADGGEPKIYQATRAERRGPGGLRETRKSERCTETGIDKMAVGRHIHDRGHVMTKQRDRRTGHMDEHQDFQNIRENELDSFDSEWNEKASKVFGRGRGRAEVGYQNEGYHPSNSRHAIESSLRYDNDRAEHPSYHNEYEEDFDEHAGREHRQQSKGRRRQ